MKALTLLPLVALSAGLVIPDESVMSQVTTEYHRTLDNLLPKEETLHAFGKKPQATAKDAHEKVDDFVDALYHSQDAECSSAQCWLSSEEEVEHGPECLESAKAEFSDSSWFSFPGRPKSHKPGHKKPTLTVYQLIAESKYTTKLAKLVNEYDDLVDLLNGTTANFTVFAPTDYAFEKVPEDAPKPSKEFLKKLLTYHVSKEYYPAAKVLTSHTISTLLGGEHLSTNPEETPQRLSFHIGLRGLTVNFYSRVVAINIFGTNGVIHGIDSILLPPPTAAEILDFVPTEFSTLELGLLKTGLLPLINDTSNHLGGTLFAPGNFAFKKLGYKINGFLFSRWGLKYLEALLKYHVVANETLYSDAFYKTKSETTEENIPKGIFHVDLPTLLEDRHLSVDIRRFGGWIEIKVNGFRTVAVQDVVARDGVVQVLSDVLIPPKKVEGRLEPYKGGELTVKDLKERLEPFVSHTDDHKGSGHFETSWEL